MLTGKTAIITGASGGIGRSIAIAYGTQHANVIVHYNGNEEKAKHVKEQIEAAGGRAEIYQCDVCDFDATEKMIKDVKEHFGSVDILVNNAGVTADGLMMAMKEEDYDKVLDTNLKGTFLCMRHATKLMMRQKWGRIINISSVSGIYGNAGQTNYSASKSGVIGLTKAAAKELASRNITVNAIAPGFIDTEMTEYLPEKVKKAALESIAMHRFGEPKDIAHAAIFFASEYASYITGQVICVDGGM